MNKRFFDLPGTRFDILFFILVGGLIWLTSSGMWDLRGPDEARYVQVAKELLGRHNWFYLTVHGIPYDQKPPLVFWLFAVLLKLNNGEVSSWLLRLPSILAAIGTVVMTYAMGRHSFGRRSGIFAALMLMTSPLFLKAAPAAELDLLYTGAITGALCAWITRPHTPFRLSLLRTTAMWGSLVTAFFIKGPLALVIGFSVIGWDAWTQRSVKVLWSARPMVGLLTTGVLIGSWLLVQRRVYGPAFVEKQVSGEIVHRFLAGDHGQPFWYYLPRLFTSILFPWSLLAIPAILIYWRSRKTSAIATSLPASPYIAWLGFPFLLLCLANGKRQSYVLPLLPAATILLGAFFSRVMADRRMSQRWFRTCAILIAGLGIVLAAFGLATEWKHSWVQTETLWITAQGSLLLAVCGSGIVYVAFWLLKSEPALKSLFYSLAAIIAIAAWANFMVFSPALDPVKTTKFLSNAIDVTLRSKNVQRPGSNTIMAVGDAAEAEYHVYGHYNVRTVRRSELVDSLGAAGTVPRVVLVKSDDVNNNLAQYLLASRFTTRREITASKDSLTMYSKPAGGSETSGSQTLSFLLFGDTGNGSPQIYNCINTVAKWKRANAIDGVFLLGDNVYHGHFIGESLQEYFVKPFAPLLALKIPFFATLGNHDYQNGRLRGEVEYPFFNMAGQRYYSLDFGTSGTSVSFFICDSESLKAGDPDQLSWLSSALSASQSRWKILLLHEPIDASQFHHGPSEHLRQLLQPMLKQVDVIFSGHNHFYERRKRSGGPLNITSGSGGQLKTGILPEDANRAVGYNASGTFLEMAVDDNGLAISAWNENGDLIDKVSLDHSASGST